MSSVPPLTQGAVTVANEPNPPTPPIVVQVLNIKAISSVPGQERYRIIISDGALKLILAMLSTPLNALVIGEKLVKHSIIRLTKYTANAVASKRLLIVLSMDLLTEGEVPKIGTPIAFPGDAGAESSAPPAQPSPQVQPVKTPMQPAPQPVKQLVPQQAPKMEKHGDQPVFKVATINPYQNKWTIKVRVISKSAIKRFKNQKGEGKLFSVTLGDESGDIRATAFGDAVEIFYNLLEEGQVFYVSKAALKNANKQWNTASSSYEMTLDTSTVIEPCLDGSVPGLRYNIIEFSRLTEVEPNNVIDCVAIVKEVGEMQTILTKKQTQLEKRDIVLVDQSMYSVRCTLWGQQAEKYGQNIQDVVIAMKGVKVGDYGGRTLSISDGASIVLNPDLPEAHRLRGWYDEHGSHQHFQTFSSGGGSSDKKNESKNIIDITEQNLGFSEKGDYITIVGTIMHVRTENAMYPACANPSNTCNKKVIQTAGGWRCEKDDMEFPNPRYRYIVSCAVADATGQTWVTIFDEDAQRIIGKSANEMAHLKEYNETDYKAAFDQIQLQQYTFKCRVKNEVYQDEAKVRITCSSVEPIDEVAYSKELIKMLSDVRLH
ncbi:replication factor-a protein [Gorgonomyces haynaldii]|nr:replication factor-a protein [Gorgonomyces haynaldii]